MYIFHLSEFAFFFSVLNMKTMCRVAAAGITLLTVHEVLSRWNTYAELVTCFNDCVLPAGTQLVEVSQGCVCFTVQADNLTGLTTLWNMYQDGTLKTRLRDFFVTDQMEKRAGGGENVEVSVTIEKEEYEKACTEFINETEGELFTMYNLIIFTSRMALSWEISCCMFYVERPI